MKKFIFLVMLLQLSTRASAQTRYFVLPSAAGAATGLSWDDAFTGLQSALQTAVAGDEIWVAAGVYHPTTSTDRNISFEPQSGVKIYGGFAGTETQLAARNWHLFPTILSGDIGIPGDSTDNTMNIMYLYEPDSLTVIDGLFFQNGYAVTTGDPGFSKIRHNCGGGLYIMAINGDAYPTIRNCTFQNNTAQNFGGGLMVNGGGTGSSVAPVITNCVFAFNRSLQFGGGMARAGGSIIERGIDIQNCRFTGNRAVTGGGLYYEDDNGTDTFDITGCRFEKNTSTNWGGGAHLSPSRNEKNYFRIDTCVFDQNSAKTAAALDVFPLSGTLAGWAKVNNSTFTGNTNTASGVNTLRFSAFGSTESWVEVINNKFISNNSRLPIEINCAYSYLYFNQNDIKSNNVYGSLIFLTGDFDTVQISRILIDSNFSSNAVLILSPSSNKISTISSSKIITQNQSASPYIDNTGVPKLYINNCYFSGQPEYFVFRGSTPTQITCIVTNSIINDTLTNNYYTQNKFQFSNNYLKNTTCADLPPDYVDCAGPVYSYIDPLFTDPANNDCHLQPCSPLINAGTNAATGLGDTDLDGQLRVRGGTVDIGPYESAPLSLASDPIIVPACLQGAPGSIAVLPVHACEPIHYTWNGPNGTSGSALAPLPAGNYLLTITDAKQDSILLPFVIPQRPQPQLQAVTTPVFCGTTTGGSATLSGGNGTPPYFFDWGNGITGNQRSGLVYGNYPVTVTDSLGCTDAGLIQIARMGNLQIDIDESPVICHNETNGAIQIIALNGAPPFQWNWDWQNSTEPGITDLPPGIYQGTLTDALGCGVNWIIPVENPDQITVNYTVSPASGPANPDGAIALEPLGGAGNFSVLWNTGAVTLAIDQLVPGIYTCTITDQNGCSQFLSVEVPWSSGVNTPGLSPVKIWPNPVANWIMVQPPSGVSDVVFTLYDGNGRTVGQVHRADSNAFYYEMGTHPPGTYSWQIVQREQQWGGVLVKK